MNTAKKIENYVRVNLDTWIEEGKTLQDICPSLVELFEHELKHGFIAKNDDLFAFVLVGKDADIFMLLAEEGGTDFKALEGERGFYEMVFNLKTYGLLENFYETNTDSPELVKIIKAADAMLEVPGVF